MPYRATVFLLNSKKCNYVGIGSSKEVAVKRVLYLVQRHNTLCSAQLLIERQNKPPDGKWRYTETRYITPTVETQSFAP